ncbi:SIMPL domain-containing protein [Sphingobium bisphenolivorans]|uniref:SIMPL domain-containing protein n=1 Tax=Sphingobium bisphenolivorans TaxID=1335760 RepID=UPI00039E691D|nr:SIMPL domain-containing protein [Sphingobium bisphenolivorans]
MKWLPFVLLAAGAASAGQAQISAASPVLAPEETLLMVSGEGQSRRIPDVAMFSAGVVTQGKTGGEALSANATRMDEVVAALKRAGIADRDIQTSALSLQPQYSNPEQEAQLRARMTREPYVAPAQPQAPRIIGYEARNNVQVRVRNLGGMGKIIDALVAAGANQVDGPSFTLDDPKAALDEARVEAVKDARARAELYARAAGLRVRRILSISEGGGYYPVQPIVVTGRMAGAPPPPPPPSPVAPGELTLGATVSMQVALQR